MGSALATAWRRPPPRGAQGPGRARFSPLPGSSRAGPARPPRAPRRRAPRTRLPTVWLASCFMRLNCFFMAAAAVAAGRGARAGENWGPSGGSYLHRFPAPEAVTETTIRPRPRRVTSSAAARPYHEWGRVEPKEAETREVEQVRTDATWVEFSGSGRGPERPRRGGWSRAERGRNQIGGAELGPTRPKPEKSGGAGPRVEPIGDGRRVGEEPNPAPGLAVLPGGMGQAEPNLATYSSGDN